MPDFKLSKDSVKKLRVKFKTFQEARKRIRELKPRYASDYRQYKGDSEDRAEYLEGKYLPLAPDFAHIVMNDGKIFWHVRDIAILLGRTQPAISITLTKMLKSEGWNARLISLRHSVKSANGNNIYVYEEGIFDLIIDRYEEEYITRFTRPRNGKSPDPEEVRKFWAYLHEHESYIDRVKHEERVKMPDIPSMTLKDILLLLWEKVFSVRIDTVCAVIFAVTFETVRRYFTLSIWYAVIPAVIAALCVILIRTRKGSPDVLSDIGAGAVLLVMLWISGVLSYPVSRTPKFEQSINLRPFLGMKDGIDFQINAGDYSRVKEFFYRISPDKNFHALGFRHQGEGKTFPESLIGCNLYGGNIHVDVKYTGHDDKESRTWSFDFDGDKEIFTLRKNFTLNLRGAWVFPQRSRRKQAIQMNPSLFTERSRSVISSVVYGLNTESPGMIILAEDFSDVKNNGFNIMEVPKDETYYAVSYIVFTDGTSSDIRREYTRE